MSAHFTRDYVWVAVTSIASTGINYQAFRNLGITGIYLWAPDNLATDAKRREIVGQGFKCGLGYPASSFQFGDDVARLANSRLAAFATNSGPAATNDNGQTPVLFDIEPSDGAVQCWHDLIYGSVVRQTKGWRGINGVITPSAPRYYRVTDFTPEPFKATVLPVQDLLDARFDVVVQTYFGDMSHVDAWEAGYDWLVGLNGVGFPKEAIHTFIDGGRKAPPPIFYEGTSIANKVRNLMPGTVVWNANLLREAGLA